MRRYDTVVIGSGSAGLFTALELQAERSVAIVTKAAVADANTNWAQGGIAAAVGDLDSPDQHLADTIAAGAGLVDEDAARILCREGPHVIAALVEHGVQFDEHDGRVDLAREAAHSTARVLHAHGDRTGAEIERALSDESRQHRVEVLTELFATRLLVEGGRVRGLEVLGGGRFDTIEADSVVIASGGAGQLYAYTTNPLVATGDGIALALLAGAEVADLEFFQFHPTALRIPGRRPFLISEAIRGEGAVLRNRDGEAFMTRYHEDADLAPRDVVARAIASEMREARADRVYLDCTGIRHLDVAERFPSIYAFCRDAGVDMRRQPVPVAPAAHYFMGGVRTDTWGRSTVAGLYACGEASATGVHGANRLASNSLLETIVFARRVADSIARGDGEPARASGDAVTVTPPVANLPRPVLQQLLWENAGIERNGPDLAAAASEIDRLPPAPAPVNQAGFEARNLTIVGRLLIEAAVRRTESRGAHFRSDFPRRDDLHWRRRQSLRIEGGVP